jgi:hypothetical protein
MDVTGKILGEHQAGSIAGLIEAWSKDPGWVINGDERKAS